MAGVFAYVTSPNYSVYQRTSCTWSVPRSGYYHTWWECVVIHTIWYWRANRLYTWGGSHTDVCTCLACSSTWSEKNSTENCAYRCCANQHNYDSKIWLWAFMASLCNRKCISIHWYIVPGLGGLKKTKMFLPHPRVKVSIVGSLRDWEVACSASDRQGSNFESCVWRTVSSQSSHHPQEVLLAQFSLYVHKGGLKPDSFHFICNHLVAINVQLMPSHAFHALTGCDVTSSFGRRGTRTNWFALEDFEDSTPALCILADNLQ